MSPPSNIMECWILSQMGGPCIHQAQQTRTSKLLEVNHHLGMCHRSLPGSWTAAQMRRFLRLQPTMNTVAR